jgi:hypothetical protein
MNNIFFTHKIKDYKGRKTTICGLLNEKGTEITYGVAVCSHKDQFNRRKGRLISQGRATKEQAYNKGMCQFISLNENVGQIFITFAKSLEGKKIL